jgi:excisionase family DNA binding protein
VSSTIDIDAIPLADIPPIVSALMMRLIVAREEPPTVTAVPIAEADHDEWLTVAETARFLRCSTRKLYRKAGTIGCCRRNGKTLLFNKAGLTKWLARQKA